MERSASLLALHADDDGLENDPVFTLSGGSTLNRTPRSLADSGRTGDVTPQEALNALPIGSAAFLLDVGKIEKGPTKRCEKAKSISGG